MPRSRLPQNLVVAVSLLTSPAMLVASGCSATQRDSTLLASGQPAPDLSATDHDGKALSLKNLRGQVVVVYFYPKDDTPGCTKEACAFRDAWDRLQAAGIQVIGVSSDDAASHRAFAAKHKLPFPLVPDTELEWSHAFGVPTTAGITHRVTFMLAPDGTVAKVYPDVDPAIHATQVLADAQNISR